MKILIGQSTQDELKYQNKSGKESFLRKVDRLDKKYSEMIMRTDQPYLNWLMHIMALSHNRAFALHEAVIFGILAAIRP